MAEVGAYPAGFREALLSRRSALNAEFESAQRLFLELSGGAFLEAFASISAIAMPALERSGFSQAAISALFRLTLRTVSSGRGGESARVLAGIAAACPDAFSRDPASFVERTFRAAERIAAASPRSLKPWGSLAAERARGASDFGEVEAAGATAAWLSGVIPYREAALRIALASPDSQAARLLALDQDSDPKSTIGAMLRDPWLSAAEASGRSKPPACVALVSGGHRALGGPFSARPEIADDGAGGALVRAGNACYSVCAAREGAWLEAVDDPGTPVSGGKGFDPRALSSLPGFSGEAAAIAALGVSSFHVSGSTVVFASPRSFRIGIAGFPGGSRGVFPR